MNLVMETLWISLDPKILIPLPMKRTHFANSGALELDNSVSRSLAVRPVRLGVSALTR